MARGRPKKEVKAEQVEKVVNANILVQLVKSKAENKATIGDLNGQLSGQIKHHVELSGLDRAAFAFICNLNTMKGDARERALRSVSLYADMMVEKKVWETHVGDLADQAAAAEAANKNEPASPAPTDDEQPEEDLRSDMQKRMEADRLAQEAAAASEAVIKAENASKIRRGISKLEAVH